MTVEQAYQACRGIARRQARNFYFAFLALPAPKRNAICAVYAFMRHADDISDDESLPLPERRARMAVWRAAWRHHAETGSFKGAPDPVFLALNDGRLRFRIPLRLLDQLVEGTAMDLQEEALQQKGLQEEGLQEEGLQKSLRAEAPHEEARRREHHLSQTFADFDELRRYCYLVASVVGLVCIRIFEYSSPQAEALAEELGLAFQLTNILRDVREDAERGRVYLPVDELARHGLTPVSLAAEAQTGAPPSAATRAMLHEQAERAERFYQAGTRLLPLIAPDSRPALWVLMTIYHRLLGRIRQAQYDVFTERRSVPTWQKLLLLARGLARTFIARLRRQPGPQPAAAPTGTHRRIAIVGAGVAGLSAACALADSGYSVTLFERRPYVGGRACSYPHPGSGQVIDNCQHILLGCCTNLTHLLTRVGRADAVAWTRTLTYIEPGGRRSVIRPTLLPAPFASAPSFLRARCFSFADKRAIAHGLRQFLRGYPADLPGTESFLSWARRHRQTPRALQRFWEPILQSALNDDLDRVSVHYAGKVLRDSFLNSPQAGRIGVPLLPLSEMYSGATAYLQARGGSVLLRTGVERIEQTSDGWRVHTGDPATPQAFDDIVLALPFEATRSLLPGLPEGADRDQLQQTLLQFQHVPLAGIHLWFDREITELPHAVLLDSTIQWMYQRDKLDPAQAGHGSASHLELVVSVAHSLVPMSQPDIVQLALEELALFFPAVREATLLKAVVTKELRATFSVPPGLDARRPSARTAWPGLYLAGDWTDTGWPATMEGAARSGFLAAEALSGTRHLVPDLPPRGFMRLFG